MASGPGSTSGACQRGVGVGRKANKKKASKNPVKYREETSLGVLERTLQVVHVDTPHGVGSQGGRRRTDRWAVFVAEKYAVVYGSCETGASGTSRPPGMDLIRRSL